ncbi:MAG: hypothetical protein FD129_1712, partial [bacterium]
MPVRLPRPVIRRPLEYLIPALALTLWSLCGAEPARAVKIMDYNILNFPSATGAAREDEFRTILAAVHPDVLVVQEVTGTTNAGMNQFLANVLNTQFPGEYAAGDWIHGSDTNNALYYRTAAFDYISADTIGTPLRAIHHFVLRPDGYASSTANLHVYSAHLKASATQAD